MLVRIMSDVHLEFGDYVVPEMLGDKDTVLVLAGDITNAGRSKCMKKVFTPFIKRCSEQFADVVMVMGNHEHYGHEYTETKTVIDNILFEQELDNVWLLEKESVVISGVSFIGTTLWTDCGDLWCENHMARMLWNGMTDSDVIKYHGKKMSIDNCRQEFLDSREFILKTIKDSKDSGYKTVVVVHHGVSDKSVHPQYKDPRFANMNIFFKSDMDVDLANANPDYVIHGHMHNAVRYKLNEDTCNTEVICNPLGYKGYESSPESRGFDPLLRIVL